ncbi:hypothetical protein CMQ_3906 [Grosmannia clavigera kw1407]|uniref:Uncharacterized protein n=1 Tax=Grosmannia clavigera (strain kw1407 / UAMH 11150) TaxID=655863 RepID=F0X8L1_GROCL|nr:uncharacterized protein CMQ_3906 [Grosmannia clavigera kw1407]EFX05837.1 hypothetical protein CMQ_3906 [Grosmannia clavigera kw1407]
MEASPLIKAHDHAREASIATHSLDTTVAVTEHALAAGEFATAAQTTASTEALRTLKLLEQHHERLSRLLRYSIEHPTQQQKKQQQEQKQQQQQQEVGGDTANEKDGTASTAAGGASRTTTASVSGVVSRGEFSNASRSRAEGQTGFDQTEAGRTGSAAAVSMSATAAAHQAGAAAMASALGSSPSSQPQRRYPATRELSSSIANNLASARGIRGRHRGQPAAPSMSNEQAPGNLDGQLGGSPDGSRTHMQSVLQQLPDGKPSWVPPGHASVAAVPSRLSAEKSEGHLSQKSWDEDQATTNTATAVSAPDDGFSRFYSRFGSFINRLSAPLAFAGLPLIAEEPGSVAGGGDATEQPPVEQQTAPHPIPPQRRRSRPPSVMLPTSPPSFGAEPELSKIYSKAALRAIGRDGHSAMDSFYVVPRTGHTASYANILSFDQKERRRMAASVHGEEELLDHGDEDAFIDAKDSQQNGRRAVRGGGREAQHVVEELYIENQSLKDMLDKLSKRLHAFEASAQHSHMALQESMRLMRPGSPLSASAMGGRPVMEYGGGGGVGAPSDEIPKRMTELEIELTRALRQLEASEKERAHQEKTLQRYRDKWEKLKADAKARKGAQIQGQGPSASDGTTTPR